MSDDMPSDEQLRGLGFMPSRIPALDALEVFVPDGGTADPEVREVPSRWYPVEGGHRVLLLYEGGPYSTDRFTLVKGGWDHEHCSRCRAHIPPMTLCWVTERGEYVLLDKKCYEEVFGPGSADEPGVDPSG